MSDPTTTNREEPDPIRDEDQGGKVNVPTAVAAGVAALIGGFLGARAGSAGTDAAGAVASAAAKFLS